MPAGQRILVYIACSLDGFIAGLGDDLSWLPRPETEPEADPEKYSNVLAFPDFIETVGALLMGRRTYDVVAGFDGFSAYGDRPVLVATHRALEPTRANVRSVVGDISELIALAREAACDKDVYLDGGALIRQAVDAELVDDFIVTIVPVLLGQGTPLFTGLRRRQYLELVDHTRIGSETLHLHLRPKR